MNWAKKLTAGDCPRCGGKLEDLGDGQASCDTCEYPDNAPDGDGEYQVVCELCGEPVPESSAHYCPVCEAHLCSDKCLSEHMRDEHGKTYCDDCGELFDESEVEGVDVTVGDKTYRFCSRGCAMTWLGRL